MYCGLCNVSHDGETMPQRVSSWYGFSTRHEDLSTEQQKHLFKYGRSRKGNAAKLDRWVGYDNWARMIIHMDEVELQRAINNIDRGWKVFGQRNKIVSLRKALARLQDGA